VAGERGPESALTAWITSQRRATRHMPVRARTRTTTCRPAQPEPWRWATNSFSRTPCHRASSERRWKHVPLPSVVRKQEVDSNLLVLWQRRANCQQPRDFRVSICVSLFDFRFVFHRLPCHRRRRRRHLRRHRLRRRHLRRLRR